MKYTSMSTTFPCCWEDFVPAFWRMFPNPHNPQVVSEDVLERRVDDGRLYSKRLLVKTFANVPRWVEALLRGSNKSYVIEESILDVENKTFVTYARNITQTIVVLEERCIYKQSDMSPEITECSRHAWATSRLWGVAVALETIAIRTFKQDVELTNKGLLYTLQKLPGRYTPDI